MATFLLVHGSFLGGWCWTGMVERLERAGHRAVTLDLPSHGSDTTPPELATMDGYRDAIAHIAATLGRPPILVEHSMGSAIASVAEAAPESVAALVFVAGLLPPRGSSLLDTLPEFDPAYLAHAVWTPDRRSVRISPDGAREFLYAGCPEDLAEQAIAKMGWEPIGPYETPLQVSEARFGSVPRYFVETTKDRVVPPTLQKKIQARERFDRVFSLPTGHAPFFEAPDQLASCLESVAAERG